MSAIRRFVREDLGCACPEDVFDDIRIEAAPSRLEAGSKSRLLVVGGRLMVLIVKSGESDLPGVAVAQLLENGARLRDEVGCNRFRLVLVPDTDSSALEQQLSGVSLPDERTHIHFIPAARVPDLSICEEASSR